MTGFVLALATSWFTDWIAKNEFPKGSGAETRSIKVRTTLLSELQQAAERVSAEALKVPRAAGPNQAALVTATNIINARLPGTGPANCGVVAAGATLASFTPALGKSHHSGS